MDDRKLGYLAIILLLLFLLGTSAYIALLATSKVEKRTIVFTDIEGLAFLNKQDPVRMHGAEVGSVSSIVSKGGSAHVTIESKHPINIHAGYRIGLTSKGVMGDKFLQIEPGDVSGPLIGKEEILEGKFQIGAPEALAYIRKLHETIIDLNTVLRRMKDGSEDRSSFVDQFNNVMNYLDSISRSVVRISSDLDRGLSTGFDTLMQVLDQAAILSRNLSETVPDIVVTVESVMGKTDKLLLQVDSVMSKADTLVDKLSDPESILWSDHVHLLQRQLREMQKIISDIRQYGLNLPVRAP